MDAETGSIDACVSSERRDVDLSVAAQLRDYAEQIVVGRGHAVIHYTIPTPQDSPLRGGDVAEVELGEGVGDRAPAEGLSLMRITPKTLLRLMRGLRA